MDPQPNSGSFNAPAGGGGSAIAAALQRRGMAPVTGQVGPGAPTFPQAPTGPLGGSNTLPSGGATQAAPPTAGAGPISKPESELIINALSTRLKDLGKMGK